MNPNQLTQQEAEFLKAMYRDWENGRRITCWMWRGAIALGAMGGAVAGLVAGWRAIKGQ